MPEVFILVTLAASSLLMSTVLLIAWSSLDAPRHAAIWAATFALAALQWLLLLAGTLAPVLTLSALLAYPFASVGGMALLTIGYRLRAALNPRVLPIIGTAIASAAASSAIAVDQPDTSFNIAPTMLANGVFLMFSAFTMVRQDRPANPAERAAVLVLVLFGLFNLGGAGIAVVRTFAGAGPVAGAEAMAMLLVLPIGYIALGLFSVFLLAADLALRMRQLATVDSLTGLLNRRGLEQMAEPAIANAQRQGRPMAVVVTDLDRFKLINDTYGHAAGDRALQRFSRHLEGGVRRGDLVARIGGEEFAVVLVDSAAAAARDVTERLRAGLEALASDMPGGEAITASFGLTMLRAHGDEGLADLIARADRALYQSKNAGRNCVTLDEDALAAVEAAPIVEPVSRNASAAATGDLRAAPLR